MPAATTNEATRIFPALRYRDTPGMIAWLKRAFGFEEHVVYANDDGSIAHAQLSFGSGMIMLGSDRDDDFGRMVGAPEAGKRLTLTIYVAVDDADAHHDRAVAAGAEIVMPLTDQEYGSRDYLCRDPEGQLWCFGTYWPKADEAPHPAG